MLTVATGPCVLEDMDAVLKCRKLRPLVLIKELIFILKLV